MAAFFPCKPCPNQCEPVFDRVVVSHLIHGHTRIMWELLHSFTDPPPLSFQVQFGRTANNNADDWINVGAPVENAYGTFDPEQRVFGKTNWAYYRVLVTSPRGTYVSAPTRANGALDKMAWLKARNLARRQKTQFRLGEGQDGYLLKRRVTGNRCHTCLDPQTLEVRDPDCPDCYGTGFQCGYFYPMSCVYANVSPRSRRTKLDGSRGTVDDIVVKARMLMTDLLGEDDVWVAKATDDRYYVYQIQHAVEVLGYPIVSDVELRPIPYSSRIYEIQIPDQLAHLGIDPEDA